MRSARTAKAAPAPSPDDSSHDPRGWRLTRPFATGFVVTLGALAAIGLSIALGNLSTVLIYVSFALFAALGLDPLVRRLEKRMPRGAAIAIVFTGFAAVMAGVIGLILPTVITQVAQFIGSVPSLVASFQRTELYLWATDQFGEQIPDLVAELQHFITNPSNLAAIGGGVLQVGASVVGAISGLLIVVVLSLYFLASLQQMKNAFYRLAPARSRAVVADLTEEITESVGGYLGGMVILALANAAFTFLMFTLLQLPFALLLAVVAFCLTIIPLVGTVLFWIVGSLTALLTDPTAAIVFAAVYLVYMQVEAYLLTPRVMSKAIAVPGSLVVIGALVGGTLLGLLGALVAIPVTASILLIVKRVFIPRQDAKTAPTGHGVTPAGGADRSATAR